MKKYFLRAFLRTRFYAVLFLGFISCVGLLFVSCATTREDNENAVMKMTTINENEIPAQCTMHYALCTVFDFPLGAAINPYNFYPSESHNALLRHFNSSGGGLSDDVTWLNNFPKRGRANYSLFFDRERKAKPAYWIFADSKQVDEQSRLKE